MFFKYCRAPFGSSLVNSLAMHLPFSFTRPPTVTELPALVRVVAREDVQWTRPVFKAPPLAVLTPVIDVTVFAPDLTHEVSSVR